MEMGMDMGMDMGGDVDASTPDIAPPWDHELMLKYDDGYGDDVFLVHIPPYSKHYLKYLSSTGKSINKKDSCSTKVENDYFFCTWQYDNWGFEEESYRRSNDTVLSFYNMRLGRGLENLTLLNSSQLPFGPVLDLDPFDRISDPKWADEQDVKKGNEFVNKLAAKNGGKLSELQWVEHDVFLNSYAIVDGSTWDIAQENAAKIGGQLAIINHQSEHNRLHSELKDKYNSLWIDLDNSVQKGIWRKPNSKHSNFRNWLQPKSKNDAKGEGTQSNGVPTLHGIAEIKYPAVADTFTIPKNISVATRGIGNQLDNKIFGNRANNILNGMQGRDTLYGGKGDDTFEIQHDVDIVVEHENEGER